jgi:hypothetical protein
MVVLRRQLVAFRDSNLVPAVVRAIPGRDVGPPSVRRLHGERNSLLLRGTRGSCRYAELS